MLTRLVILLSSLWMSLSQLFFVFRRILSRFSLSVYSVSWGAAWLSRRLLKMATCCSMGLE